MSVSGPSGLEVGDGWWLGSSAPGLQPMTTAQRTSAHRSCPHRAICLGSASLLRILRETSTAGR